MLVDELRPKMQNVPWEALRDLVASVKPTATKIEIIRNNALAHRSADLDFDGAFRKAKVTRPELKELLKVALQVANEMASIVDTKSVAFHSAETKRDMRKMFEALGSTFSGKKDVIDELFDT